MYNIDKFISQANQVLTNNDLNKEEKKIFLAGLFQAYLGLTTEDHWDTLLDEELKFIQKIEEM